MGICFSNNILGKRKKVTNEKQSGMNDSRNTNFHKNSKAERNLQKETEKSTEMKAALLIQKWFRLWLSKLQARRKLAWRIFQKVEYYDERNQMRLNRFFRSLIQEFSDKTSKSKVALFDQQRKENLVMLSETEIMEIPSDVEVNISPPFSIEKLNELINFLKTGKNLNMACVNNLLILTTEKMKTKSNFNEVNTSVTNKVTICGDLHGSLDDLLTIFYKNNLPSLNNPYIFNGDFVDRGPKSIEVAMILCYSFLLFPNHVHLNRGNHEDPNLNEKYGFIKEIMTKYRHSHRKITNVFKTFYRALPLGTIIDQNIFVVHGGISSATDLNILGDIQRTNYTSIIKPPLFIVQKYKGEWEQVMDILWSDPVSENGCEENEIRGGGKCFGPDVTEAFLRKHNFELLIRSHECKPEGYEYYHSGKMLTVFSSSNYYHPGSNKGAYIVYTGDVNKLRHIQFLSNDEALKDIKFKDKVVSMEEKAINDLKRMLCTNRNQLLKKFNEKDVNKTGKISIEDYGNTLSEVLGMSLPWRLVQPKISKKDKDNLIIYESSFDYTQKIQEESASDVLYNNLDILETIFRAIDKDNSGFITMAEFTDAMSVLQKHSDLDILADDIEDLGELIDLDKDGFIDINEFFEAFKLSNT